MNPLLRDGRPIERILIRVNNWIGDVVMISPAMRAIRKRFPRAEITLLAKTGVLEALDVGKKAGVPVHIFHYKVKHPQMWGKLSEFTVLIDQARVECADQRAAVLHIHFEQVRLTRRQQLKRRCYDQFVFG